MRLRLAPFQAISAPSFEPVSLEAAYLHLRRDNTPGDDEALDAEVLRWCQTAREQVENFTGLLLTDAVYEARFDCWSTALLLPAAPVATVVSVSYMNDMGVLTAVDPATYAFDTFGAPVVRLKRDQTWPTDGEDGHALRVRFSGGYDDPAAPDTRPLPASLYQAMLLHIGSLDEDRRNGTSKAVNEPPLAARHLAAPYRITWGV